MNSAIFAQPEVDHNRAVYGKVIYHNTQDSLLLEDSSPFTIGDTVLYHHTISGFAYDSTSQIGEIRDMKNAGIYGIYLIEDIVGNFVKLNNVLPLYGSFPHRNGDYGQLIKVPTYEKARFTNSFVFPAWDPVAKTGGIFPILVRKKLIIESDLSAEGKGFKGAVPTGNYLLSGGKCSDGNFTVDDNYFTGSAVDSGAFKGETFCNNTGNGLEVMTRGRGRIGTGGGGGNALYSGGGGGSNKGTGGSGGDESDSCAAPGVMGGLKGHAINYSTDPANAVGNRIHMGGGGGTANQDPALGRFASAGGSGGGIFIIITDTLETSGNHSVSANGASVSGIVDAGAGGGGGGGVIVIDVNTYTGNLLSLNVKGGKGGDVSGIPYNTGPGGGGGGGVVQYNGASLDPAFVTVDRTPGISGKVIATGGVYNAFPGTIGERQSNLKIPILGFLFNTIPDDQTICQGELPPLLNAGSAKGASGTYNYLWYQSADPMGVFVPASTAQGPNNQQTYQPPLLDDTTYYKRYAEDKIKTAINSITEPMAINVHPRLEANYILADDTTCFNVAPILPLTSDSTLRGGDGNGYFYSWEKSENTNDNWTTANATIDQFDYQVPALGTTTYFRRVVSSGVCVNISDTVKITVLPSITDNTIGDDQFLCNLENAVPLDGLPISGGELTDKRYQWWEIKGGSWTLVSTGEDYNPLSLAANNYEYRRIAFSGSENACIDTSNAVNIIVYPDLANNSISTMVDTICANLPGITIAGETPTGGKLNDYAYSWEISPNGTSGWISGAGTPDTEDFQPGTLNATTWFRRIVYSAISDSACSSTSNTLKIEVLPVLVNTLTSSDATICQFTNSPQINGNPASGGLPGDYRYQWQFRESDADWADAAITSDGINFLPGTLSDTSFFRRAVFSGPLETCVDYSDSIKIFVQPAIQFNEFESPGVQDTCFASEVVIPALEITGGDGTNTYLWQESNNSGSLWIPASGAINNQQDYTLSSLEETTWFRRIASSGECVDTSIIKIINPQALPELLALASSDNLICTTNELFLLLDMKVKNTNLEVSYSDNFGGNFQNIPVSDDKVPIGTSEDGIFEYTLNQIKDENGCLSVNTGSPVTVQIDKSLIATINEPDNYEVCGFGFDLTGSLDSESLGDYTISWEVLNQDTFLIGASGETNATFETVPGISTNFSILETLVSISQNTLVCPGIKDSIKVVLYRPLDDINIVLPESKIMYFRDWDTISVYPDTIGTHFWELNDWALENSAEIVNPNANPVRIENIPITENKLSGGVDNTTVVSYTLSNGVCTPRNLSLELIRNEVRVYEGISPNQSPGENDYLIAEGLKAEGLNSFSFQIYSSNGMLVRELTQDDVDDIVLTSSPGMDDDAMVIWDGKNKNGNDYVVPGTYYYVLVLDFKGIEFVDKGFVVVK
ncbi:MAG: gliding motility-associated C-terminal domain-containing protein [Bacteroidales bacterium]|nr:gliding motility-associated C-terminal domain-containing protein [Bacteroidales bacterium]MCF8389956.1 gliding motility-associated C-terminal domain-containing protein [Bacteroidales bacterium]